MGVPLRAIDGKIFLEIFCAAFVGTSKVLIVNEYFFSEGESLSFCRLLLRWLVASSSVRAVGG